MGGIIDFFNPKKIAKVNTPPPRNLEDEINTILGLSDNVYNSAAEWSPKYTDLFTGNAARATQSLTGTYTDTLNGLLPESLQRLRGINPGQASLYDTLLGQAQTGLAQGSRLRPDDTRAIAKGVAGDYANRGFSTGLPAAELEQAMQLYGGGEAIRGQRQGFAQSILDQGNQVYTAPAVGMANQAAGELLNMGGSYSATQPSVLDQLGSYGSDVFNTNYNAQAAANIATANNKTSLASSALSY